MPNSVFFVSEYFWLAEKTVSHTETTLPLTVDSFLRRILKR